MHDSFKRIPLGNSALRGFGLFAIHSLSPPPLSSDPSFSPLAALPQPGSFPLSGAVSYSLLKSSPSTFPSAWCSWVSSCLFLPSPDSGDPLSNQLLTFQSCQSDQPLAFSRYFGYPWQSLLICSLPFLPVTCYWLLGCCTITSPWRFCSPLSGQSYFTSFYP